MSVCQKVMLSSGFEMPVVGLGSWQSSPDDVEAALTTALNCGYRHIDTASAYENEEGVGRSLKKWIDEGGDREEVFVTTKLHPAGNRASDVEMYVNLSLERLGLDYIDMYLIHNPLGLQREVDGYSWHFKEDGSIDLDYDTDLAAVWKAMEEQVEAGKLRSIGISNFNESQILNIVNNCKIKPSNLQIEVHAYNQQRATRELAAEHDMVVTAYSTLGSPGAIDAVKRSSFLEQPKLLENPLVQTIAEAHGKTTAQVLLRQQVQEGLVVIPKSTNPERIAENIDIFDFELSEDEMQQLAELDCGEDGRIFNFSLFWKGADQHPENPY